MSNNTEIPSFGDKKDVEFRLFKFTLWITVFVFAIWWLVAVIASYTSIIKLTYSVCLFIYSGLLIALYRGVSLTILATIYYSFCFIILSSIWLPAGGITGTIMITFIMVFVSGLLVLPLPAFLTYILCSFFLVGIYFGLELDQNDLATLYTDNFSRTRDFGIAGIISLLSIGAALYIFKKEHIKDRQNLRTTILALEKEKEKAQSADKAKSDFLATISHEMRTPLNGIVGISELLKETNLDNEQEILLANLSYSSEHLRGLISDILDVTLIESGNIVIQSNEIEIESEIEKIIEIVKPKLDKKKGEVDLVIEHDPTIPFMLIGDSLRLRQVLLNLINNAIKFTENGTVKVSTELFKRTNKSVSIQFKISDTGKGISENAKEQLFNKFYKGGSDANIEGTGLGLSISKNLVSLMGGTIGFESEENVGSSFFFELPFKTFQTTQKEKVKNELKEKSLDDIKILIVEDVRINQLVIKKMAENLGLKSIEIAENGESAVQKTTSTWFDVILMDIQMPKMDGVQASKLISENYDGKKKPIIIAVTANALASDQKKYEKVGINGYLSKPITKESLREALSKFI
ncbi:MAG: hypothetical protein BalsKO_21100 [Balneolaceae bacterium]